MTTAFTPDNSNPRVQHIITEREDGMEHITVLGPGGNLVSIAEDHPNFKEIRDGLKNNSMDFDDVKSKFDMTEIVAKNFRRISERVSVTGGKVYFDGDEVHSTLTDHIVRCVDAGHDDYKPLVAFMDKLAQNPQEHSRDQLYTWLTGRDFTITQDGDFIAYKGVKIDEDGNYVSVFTGPAIVNGTPVNGHVPNPVGGVIEIARSKVHFDPTVGCASGLHAGSYEYAKGWARGALLKVKINPRDVVSVPTDCNFQKVRTCRYTVLEQIDAPETIPVAYDYDEYDEDTEYCECCGQRIDDDIDLLDELLCEDCYEDEYGEDEVEAPSKKVADEARDFVWNPVTRQYDDPSKESNDEQDHGVGLSDTDDEQTYPPHPGQETLGFDGADGDR